MNGKDILHALNDIDPQLAEAAPPRKKHRLLAAAACFLLILGAAAGILRPWELRQVDLGGITRLYRNRVAMHETSALIFPWEYRPIWDQYTALTLDDRGYRTRARTISAALIGDPLGIGTATGYDIYTETTPQAQFPVYAIQGIDPELLVAVQLEEAYFVYMQDEYSPPANLGEFLKGYALAETAVLGQFTISEDYQNQGYYRFTGDPDRIWLLLSQCTEAVCSQQEPFKKEARGINFAISSEALGIYKKSFRIGSDGYLETNAAEYGYAFYIGEEAAAQILNYVLSNSEEAAMEPYEYYLTGTITEIREGCFLLDDSILAAGKGMVFQVPTNDLLIRRWLEFGGIGVGDLVTVTYSGGIEEGIVQGATRISRSQLADGSILIYE